MEEVLTFHLEKVVRARHDDYEDFVGPLDLILHLLSKNKIEIKDIRISEILEQYLTYLARMKSMDLEIASEFTAMASHLVYIKTRMLLSINDEEANAEMDLLIQTLEQRRRLEDLARIQAACGFFEGRQEFGRNILLRVPEPLSRDKSYTYVHSTDDLIDALRGMTDRDKLRLPPPVSAFTGIIGREIYPVSEKITDILNRFVKKGICRLRSLFYDSKSRSEVVATFLAVLEMCKNRKILVHETADGDYDLTPCKETK